MNKTFSYTHCNVGVATRDVTPPVGIYARSWGAATHDTAEGVHRPFAATAAVFAPLHGDGPTLALVAVDLGWFQHVPDEQKLRATILERTGLDDASLLINMSHTHSGANVNTQLSDKPGAELVEPYIEHLTEQLGAAILEARETAAPSWVTYGSGRCALATNRDLWDTAADRWACGYNPDEPADDTLLVARVTSETGEVRATLFNYACHPTTLAWENRLLSPDYIGAAREVLEQAFGAPALFFHGASGDLAPRDDYVGDTSVADSNGRQLGHAAAAAIENLPPPGTQFVYTGIVPSGANLGAWEYQPCDEAQREASEQLAALVSPCRAAAQGGHRGRRERLGRDSRLGPGAGEGVAAPVPHPGARRRSDLHDAALDLAARRRAARRRPERALLRLPGRAAPPPRGDAACSCSARRTGRWATSRPRRPTAPGSTRSSSRRSRPGASSRRWRSPRRLSRRCVRS